MLQKIKPKKFKLGIVGGGPGSWIGHVHRISSRYDDKYEIVAGVFSRSVDKSRKFGQSIGLDKSRCYSNYKEMSEKEAKRKDGINVVGPPNPEERGGIMSFNLEGWDPTEIAMHLDEEYNIAIRSGMHCVHSWFNSRGIDGTARSSVYFYNTEDEVKRFTDAIRDMVSK